MLELRIMQGRRAVPLFDLPTRLGRVQAAREIGDAIEGLIAYLDDLGGDPDLETTGAEDDFMDHHLVAGVWIEGAGCPVADPDLGGEEAGEAASYAEWHSLPASRRRAGHIDGRAVNEWRNVHEDDEDDDQDTCLAADDDPARRISDGLPGDSFDTEKNGDEDDYTPGVPHWEG